MSEVHAATPELHGQCTEHMIVDWKIESIMVNI